MLSASTGQLDLSNPRYWHQNAKQAVRDIYDALVELITNSDDSYQRARAKSGRIEIDIERRRKGKESVVRVRDFAEGMSTADMERKLRRVAGRVSGLAHGERVRGTNSRGAKDVAVVGEATFESIASDGRFHSCTITDRAKFSIEPDHAVTAALRKKLGLPSGTGTVVTLSVRGDEYTIPQHETLCDQLGRLVALRDIVGSPDREIVVQDRNQNRQDVVRPTRVSGHEVKSARFEVPGYPAEAKLTICRSEIPLEIGVNARFREGGFIVKARHAIHEATLFAPELEHDPNAAWFYGRLSCEYIDELWNDYDDRFERQERGTPQNPTYIFDPLRKEGLRREHPFTKALFAEALKRVRPLIEEEKKRRESERAKIESRATRERLRTLEREAAKFMNKYWAPDDPSRDPSSELPDGQLRRRGYSLSPPFAQIVRGQSIRFWLSVSQEAFPELSVGSPVEIDCASDDIRSDKGFGVLEPHPGQPSILRIVWNVKGERVTPATGVSVRVGPIVAESTVEVLESEKDRYSWVKALCFSSNRFVARKEGRKQIDVLAPLPTGGTKPLKIEATCDHKAFHLHGEQVMQPLPELGIMRCRLKLSVDLADVRGTLHARLGDESCNAAVVSLEPPGFTPVIKVEDKDFGSQRYLWRGAVIEIGARHPSLKRYLGQPPDFDGQEEKHFRLLLAEIVAEAVCAKIVAKSAEEDPIEFQDADWDTYYAEYTKLVTEFLPIAHKTQLPAI